MDKQIELKRLILDFNTVVARLNKAEIFFNDNKVADIKKDNAVELYTDLLRQASSFANKIETFLGRPLTSYESLHGINI